MLVFQRSKEILKYINQNKKSIGLVPTMGALHLGHISLIKKALIENKLVIVSIFVNPTQFDNHTDLKNYPKDINTDIKRINYIDKGIIIYTPLIEDLYGKNVIVKKFDFGFIGKELEGYYRKNHFNAVATIVEKLFKLFNPKRAYFGEKDYQQILIIKSLIKKSNLDIQIVSCPIIRDFDGLALSSRNKLLSSKEKKLAPLIYKTLLEVNKNFGNEKTNKIINNIYKKFKSIPSLELDYFEIRDSINLKPIKNKNTKQNYRAFIAVRIGEIRLVDNMELSVI